MRVPRLAILLAVGAVLVLPASLPALADGGDDEDEDDREGRRDGREGDEAGQGRRGEGDRSRDGDDDGDERHGRGDKRDADERNGDERERDKDDKRGKDDQDGKKDKEGKGDGRRQDDQDGRDERDGDVRDRHAPVPAPRASAAPGASPRLAVSQDYDVAPGLMTYRFTVENRGLGTLQDVQLVGAVPDVASWAVADPLRCDLTGEAVACDVGDLAPGATRTVAVQGVVVNEVPPFTNVVQVYTPLGPGAPSSP